MFRLLDFHTSVAKRLTSQSEIWHDEGASSHHLGRCISMRF